MYRKEVDPSGIKELILPYLINIMRMNAMENKKIKVAVIGATGAVGQVFMWMLSDHPWFELSYVTASAARVGQKYAATVHWVMPFEMPESIKDIMLR